MKVETHSNGGAEVWLRPENAIEAAILEAISNFYQMRADNLTFTSDKSDPLNILVKIRAKEHKAGFFGGENIKLEADFQNTVAQFIPND
jgi:hypothetical protein